MQERHNPKVSWIAWFVLLSAFLAVRVIGKPEIELGRDYMLCAWIPLMFINFYTGHKLIAYLKNHHTKKWEELTTVGGGWPRFEQQLRVHPLALFERRS